MKIGGGLILAIGAVLTFVSFVFETSVPSSLFEENSSRTMNIGLMQDQQNILITGLCLVLCGIILIVGGSLVEQLESIKISNRTMLLKEAEKGENIETKQQETN